MDMKELMKKYNVGPVHMVVLLIGISVLIIDLLFFRDTKWFFLILIFAITISWLQFWISFFIRNQKQKELEEKFPEFVRNLVNSVKSGMPIPLAIKHISDRDYGSLTPHVRKLANQVEWSIPLHKSLWNFALATDNHVIKRSIATVIEAEKSGGHIEDVLDSVTASVLEIKKMKAKRKADINSQVIQSYIIFFVFLGVMIIIQNSLVPYLALMEGGSLRDLTSSGINVIKGGMSDLATVVKIDYSSVPAFFGSLIDWFNSISGIFFMIAIIQGFFAGLVLGKLAEANIKSGLKHSLILMTIAAFTMSFAMGFL
jgi:flagellar protein FlaJ